MQQHDLTCDVLVAGGGPAGVPCAIAAARCGARVILCQDRPVLGGNASSEVRMHIVGADASGGRSGDPATEAREGGIIEEIRLDTAVRNPQRSASMLDLILYEKVRAEPDLTLMLNTTVVGATVKGDRITHVRAVRESTEDVFHIAADVFVDCTGDGRLGAEAGAAFRHGREGIDEHGEPDARPRADAKTLGSTLLFTARRHDRPMPFTAPPWARRLGEKDLKLRSHGTPGQVDGSFEYGYWWVEWGGHLDTIKDNETIRDELLAIMLGVWDHVKNGGDHGADCWALEWFGFLPGKRESRRFVGRHVLTEQEVLESRPFHDAIAYGGWPIDLHPPEGVDAPHRKPAEARPVPHLYDVPLRCCVARDVTNLMFAGRNISATHCAFGSTRVMATCAVIGQGVGTAAAHAVANGLAPAQLADDGPAIHAIQQRLLRDDCYLIGAGNQDDDDLARHATITASSGDGTQVVTGQTRSVHGARGAPPDRARPGPHRWMSAHLPAWIELAWDRPIRPGRVELVFDTGLSRILTLSHDDTYTGWMRWGVPQPECVRDYRIDGRGGAAWQTMVVTTGNHQRRRVHQLPGEFVTALRITVTAAHGIDHARICEVRVYEQA